MKKAWQKILIIIVIVIIGIGIAVHLFADMAVKMGIESQGTKALTVGVKVGGVHLSILGGSLELNKLAVDNPPGYQFKKLLELDNAFTSVNIGSLMSDIVDIKELKLNGANVVIEQKGINNNMQDIMTAMKKKEKPPQQEGGKKLRIDKLEITNVVVQAKLLPVPGKEETVTLKLAPITMNNLGGDNKMDTAELVSKVLIAIADGIAQQGDGVLPADMMNSVKSSLSNIEKVLGDGNDLMKQGGELKKELGGLKGIFGPKDSNKK